MISMLSLAERSVFFSLTHTSIAIAEQMGATSSKAVEPVRYTDAPFMYLRGKRAGLLGEHPLASYALYKSSSLLNEGSVSIL